MPTTWKRSPEEFHKIYIANTEAFYKTAGASLAPELDAFMVKCALGLWSRAASVTQEHADMANELYSKGQPKPSWLLWSLTEKVCAPEPFLPPMFFWSLAEGDAKRGSDASRVFIRMMTNILLYLAACDDDVNLAEARYVTDAGEKLSAICDSSGVAKSKPGLNPLDFVTSGEPDFVAKHTGDPQSAEEQGQAPAAEKAAEGAQEKKPSFDELMAQLDGLVGLEDVKKDVKSLINLIKVRKLRVENGLPVPPMSMHMVFVGNPGTGKTTVARLISGLYAAVGALSKGQLIEVDRSGLVAGYVGQTALKTQEAVKSALGGVLFIDEAYSLANGGENDFGREATETILKAMEDHRDDLVIIVAGYDEPMRKFLSSNPGLESRFNKYFYFPDYNGEQLMTIFKSMCDKNGYALTPEAEKKAADGFDALYKNRDANFGNGRDVRNRFEDMVTAQSNRVAALEKPGKDDLMAVKPEDIEI